MLQEAQLKTDDRREMLPRVNRVRDQLMAILPEISPERALLITESYKQTEGLPMILRRAKALEKILTEMPIYIEDEQMIVGNQAGKNRAAPIFPEYSIDWVIEELDEFHKRPGDVFTITEDTKDKLRSIHSYWHGNTHQDQVARTMTEVNKLAVDQGVVHRGGISMSGDGHIIPKHEKVLELGFGGLIEEAERRKSELNPADPDAEDKGNFYEASIIAMKAAIHFSHRYANLARELAGQELNADRHAELIQIAEMCDRVPELPAISFHDACQVVYFCHLIMMIESNGHSFSFGRFDQYAHPYYQADVQSGNLTRDEALEILSMTFLKFNTLNKVRPWNHTEFGVGYPLYSNLMVGG